MGLHSTRFGRPTEQPMKRFIPTADKSAKAEQVLRQPNMQLLQETKKARKDKAQRADQKSGQHEEINYVGSSAEIQSSDPNILSIENLVELEVLLTSKESSTWLLDSGTSYHVTPHRS